MEGISIIICFYNAENKLKDTLKYIKELDVNTLVVELILVNNNSSDNSVKVINDLMADFDGFVFRIVEENNPGLTNARLKGISESKYDILLFCDDDNWLEKKYLQIGYDQLINNNRIAVLGGLGKEVSTVEIPEWFKDVENYYAVGPQFSSDGRVLGSRNVVYGAGMFIRKEYFNHIYRLGYVPFNTDRIGNSLASGGDSELCLAFQISGYEVWYNSELKFNHFIEPKRLTLDYLSRLQKGMNESAFVSRFFRDYLKGYRPDVTSFFWIKELILSLKDSLLMISKFNFKIKRNTLFQLFLIKNRQSYNKNVKSIVDMCDELSNNAKI